LIYIDEDADVGAKCANLNLIWLEKSKDRQCDFEEDMDVDRDEDSFEKEDIDVKRGRWGSDRQLAAQWIPFSTSITGSSSNKSSWA
jgi:hypothetical protein